MSNRIDAKRKATCGVCKKHDANEPLYLHARCHIKAPPWAYMLGEHIIFECSVCKREVGRLKLVQPLMDDRKFN